MFLAQLWHSVRVGFNGFSDSHVGGWEGFFLSCSLPEQLQQLPNEYGHGYLFVRVGGGKARGKTVLMIPRCFSFSAAHTSLWFMLDSMTLTRGQIPLYLQGHGSVSRVPSLYLCL